MPCTCSRAIPGSLLGPTTWHPGSFIDAALFSCSAPHTLRSDLSVGLAFLFLGRSVTAGRNSYNREVGLITLVLLAIPTPTWQCAEWPFTRYLNLAVTHPGQYRSPATSRESSRLSGATFRLSSCWPRVGYAFWLHLLIISYIVVAALSYFSRTSSWLIRKEFWDWHWPFSSPACRSGGSTGP